MVGAQRGDVDEYGVSVALYLVLLPVFVEKVLGDLVGLPARMCTFSLVIISSSSRLTWKSTYLEETLP